MTVIKSIDVTGLDELQRQLLRLENKVATKEMNKALVKSIRPVVRDAKLKAPKMTGALAASIGYFVRRGRGRNFATVFAGPKQKAKRAIGLAQASGRKIKGIFYGHIVEMGGGRMARPQPFMRPAMEQNRTESVRIFRKTLRAGILSVTRK